MKISKREENWIIIHFVFYFILTIWLVYFLISNFIPEIIKIENNKKITKSLYEKIMLLQSKWLTFNEFIDKNKSWDFDRVNTEILKNMTEDFYTKNLVNTNTNTSYDDFLESIKKQLNSPENIASIDAKNNQISNILPSYSIPAIDFGWNILTDYKFINYIESILETFGLSNSSSIGINKIVLEEDFVWLNNPWDSLNSNIYYIPLNLVLRWEKSWIIDFLYFVENVWSIKIDDNNLYLNKNYDFLSKNWRKIVLEWEELTSDYNILEHQFIDIEKISMNEYIDSSYKSRWDLDFKKFIVNEQWTEKFEINVNLLFYIKGQPTYKTEEFINNIFLRYIETIKLNSEALKDPTLDEITRRKLTSQNISLNQMNKEMTAIKKELINKNKLEDLYKRAMNMNEIIEPIFNNLKK